MSTVVIISHSRFILPIKIAFQGEKFLMDIRNTTIHYFTFAIHKTLSTELLNLRLIPH